MMLGELDYAGMLLDNTVNNNTVPGTDIPYVPLPALTFCLFFVFVVMVSVVLVNLLVRTFLAKCPGIFCNSELINDLLRLLVGCQRLVEGTSPPPKLLLF